MEFEPSLQLRTARLSKRDKKVTAILQVLNEEGDEFANLRLLVSQVREHVEILNEDVRRRATEASSHLAEQARQTQPRIQVYAVRVIFLKGGEKVQNWSVPP